MRTMQAQCRARFGAQSELEGRARSEKDPEFPVEIMEARAEGPVVTESRRSSQEILKGQLSWQHQNRTK